MSATRLNTVLNAVLLRGLRRRAGGSDRRSLTAFQLWSEQRSVCGVEIHCRGKSGSRQAPSARTDQCSLSQLQQTQRSRSFDWTSQGSLISRPQSGHLPPNQQLSTASSAVCRAQIYQKQNPATERLMRSTYQKRGNPCCNLFVVHSCNVFNSVEKIAKQVKH